MNEPIKKLEHGLYLVLGTNHGGRETIAAVKLALRWGYFTINFPSKKVSKPLPKTDENAALEFTQWVYELLKRNPFFDDPSPYIIFDKPLPNYTPEAARTLVRGLDTAFRNLKETGFLVVYNPSALSEWNGNLDRVLVCKDKKFYSVLELANPEWIRQFCIADLYMQGEFTE